MNQQMGAAGESPVGRPKKAWVYFGVTAIVLSCLATAMVIGNMAAGAPRQTDEDTWAHLFQLAMALQLPLLLLFLATADWKQSRRVFWILGAQILAVAAAFGALAWSGY